MAQLIPVDHDPFATAPSNDQSAAYKLVPVDIDPFAAGASGGPKGSLPMFAQSGMAQAEDLAKSGGVGLVKGATGLAGMIGTAGQAWDAAPAAAAGFALRRLEKWGVVEPGTADKLDAEVERDRAAFLSPAERDGTVNKIAGIPFATPKGFDSIVQSAAGKYYEPKTKLGQYAQTTGEFIPGAIAAPGSIAGNALKFGIGPGIASEAAGQATAGTSWEPWARGTAALVAGGASHLATRPGIETRMIGQATRGASDAQINAATQLMREANARGVQITWAEALQQVTGGATQAGRLQRVVESTKEGGSVLSPAMAARPGQMNAAVDAELNRISPQAPRPYDVAPQVQQVGVDAMQAAERMRTRASSPYYRAAEADRVNPNAVRSIVGGIDRQMAQDTTGVLSGPLGQTRSLLVERQGQPAIPATRTPVTGPDGRVIRYETTPARDAVPEVLATDIPNLDRARKFTRDQNELPPFAAQAIPKEAGAAQGNITAQLRDRMERASPNFAQGRQEYERLSRSVVDPMTNSPTGQLANAATPEAQRGILFPQNPLPGSERGIGNAVGSIANRNPDLARQVVRQEAERVANNTVRGLDSMGRPDQLGGAKYARTMRDNPQVATNFEAAMGRAGADTASHSNLMDVLQATGWRERPGSMTAFNASDLKDMASGGLLSASADAVKTGNPLSLMKQLKENIDRHRLGARAENVARGLLANPDDAANLLRRAREATPEGAGARSILGLLLSNQPNIRAAISDERGKR